MKLTRSQTFSIFRYVNYPVGFYLPKIVNLNRKNVTVKLRHSIFNKSVLTKNLVTSGLIFDPELFLASGYEKFADESTIEHVPIEYFLWFTFRFCKFSMRKKLLKENVHRKPNLTSISCWWSLITQLINNARLRGEE